VPKTHPLVFTVHFAAKVLHGQTGIKKNSKILSKEDINYKSVKKIWDANNGDT